MPHQHSKPDILLVCCVDRGHANMILLQHECSVKHFLSWLHNRVVHILSIPCMHIK